MNIFERITKTVGEKAGRIKDATWEKVEDVNDSLDMQAQYRFVNAVAKDEGVSYQEAVEYCTVGSPKWIPKYSLGYKMQAPHVTVMLSTAKGKAAFKRDLVPEELELFENKVEGLKFGDLLREQWKKQKKEQKAAKKAAKKRANGLEIKSAKKKEGGT